MLTTLILAALVAQKPTLTFTHRCARAEVVVAALGEALGRKMKVIGSVKDDYFLVRFDGTPVDKALERIAKTLNATWTMSGETEYLTRLPAQENAEQREEQAWVEASIARYAAMHRVPDLPGKDELTKILQAGADARRRGVHDENAAKAALLNPDNVYRNAFFQMLDPKALASLPTDGFYFMSLRPHAGLASVPPDAKKQLDEIARYATAYDEVVELLNSQSGDTNQSATLVNRNLFTSTEILFGAVRDLFTLELITFRTYGNSTVTSSGAFIDLLGSGSEPQEIPGARGKFKAPFDLGVAEVFARPRSTTPAPETSDKVYAKLLGAQQDDPLSWLASEPILQAAEAEGWDVVAVLPDPLGWDAWWLPQAPDRPLGDVLKAELAGWSIVEFEKESRYLSVKPQMAGAFRRSRIDRAQVVRTIEAVKARKRYLEEIAAFYEWGAQKEQRSSLLRLISSSIAGLKPNTLDREFEDDAMMLLGSMSPSERNLARRVGGMSLTAAGASPNLQKGLRRLIARCATERLVPKIEDGKVVGSPTPAIFALLTSDPAQTTLSCRILKIETTEAVVFEFAFPSGGLLRLSAEMRLPAKSNP